MSLILEQNENADIGIEIVSRQKKTTVEEELVKSLETLYTKSVPAGVRDFIALRSGEVTEQSVAKSKKVKPPKDNLTDNHQEPENNEFGK